MRMILRSFRFRDERGNTIAVVALSLVLIIGMIAFSADFGSMYLKRRVLVNANDAAALAFAESCANPNVNLNADQQADLFATKNASDAVRMPGSPSQWPVTGVCTPQLQTGGPTDAGSVTVKYQGQANRYFAPILGFSSTQTVAGQATAAWGPAGGAGGVLPVMLSMGRLSTCQIPGTNPGTECWFYWDNSQLGTATWALMNVEPSCSATKYGWDVSVTVCPSKVTTPNPTYKCPTWSDSDLINVINNGSPALKIEYPNPTYVCTVPGQKNNVFVDIASLKGSIRLFPVNDPNGQIKNGGIPAPPPITPDFYDIVGFIQMQILDVWRGNDNNWDSVHCPGPKNANAWCLHAKWIAYTISPGPICTNCQDFGVRAVQLKG